jgi:hypothetical protein
LLRFQHVDASTDPRTDASTDRRADTDTNACAYSFTNASAYVRDPRGDGLHGSAGNAVR